MLVTVAICTWNRAKLLDQTLAQMCKLRIPEGVEWELLVVNNNSTDNTEAIVASYANRLPIRHLLERRQGQSHARNCAIDAGHGELFIWTDDDVLVDEGWLSAYVAAANRWPAAGFFGGQIIPWFAHTPPQWLLTNQRRLAGLLVARDLESIERLLAESEWPFGANMAFRRSTHATRQFDPNLGLKGDDAIRCDETVYCQALHEAGFQGVWVPAAKVRHYVIRERMTLVYVWKYYEGHGRGLMRIAGRNKPRPSGRVPRWMYRQYWEPLAKSWLLRALRRPGWLAQYIAAAEAYGKILEYRSSLAGKDVARQHDIGPAAVDLTEATRHFAMSGRPIDVIGNSSAEHIKREVQVHRAT